MKKIIVIAIMLLGVSQAKSQKVFSVDSKYDAEWRDSSKKQLMY